MTYDVNFSLVMALLSKFDLKPFAHYWINRHDCECMYDSAEEVQCTYYIIFTMLYVCRFLGQTG